MTIPPEFKAGAKDIADRCGWIVKSRSDGRWNVSLRERYEGRRPVAFTLERVVDATTASEDAPYRKFEQWTGQDRYLSDRIRGLGLKRLKELEGIGNRVAVWEGFRLSNLIATDAELPGHLREVFPVLSTQLPKASLWMLTINPVLHTREAAVRAFLTAQEAPEHLARVEKESLGFEAGRGLGATEGMGSGVFVETGLLVAAPGVLGMVTARLPGMVLLLFGHFESGRDQGVSGELIDLFRPQLLSDPQTDTLPMPPMSREEIERYVRWWVDHVNGLMELVVDPALFKKDDGTEDGSYDAVSHFGFQLSVDRLFATLKGILVASRRDEFARSILAYQALDLLRGLETGEYTSLANPREVRAVVEELKQTLPADVAKAIMPRCESAVSALESLKGGFYLSERLTAGGLRRLTKAGPWETISLDRAVAEYVNLVRDAGHSLQKKMRDRRELSLFVAHDGRFRPELADVAFIHLIRLLADPETLRRRLSRGA